MCFGVQCSDACVRMLFDPTAQGKDAAAYYMQCGVRKQLCIYIDTLLRMYNI